jgi:hypothetical protein
VNHVAVGTIVAKNYLSFARVLGRSLREHHPDVPFFVVLADQVEGTFDPAAEPFQVVPLEALEIPDLRRLCFRYSRQQVGVAAKPYLLRYLLGRGFAAAVFLDADILVVGPLDPLLTDRHSIVLTPHLLEPLTERQRIDRELRILQSGVFNGGFLGVSETPIGHRFLAWWANRLNTHCRLAVGDGMHYDQRWLDLVPAFFDDVCIIRDAGCNVAYWNLPERGAPIRFFHFSGFDPDKPSVVTRFAPVLKFEAVGPASALFQRYVRLLEQDGYTTTRSWSYAYDRFDNGVRIPDLARRMYLDLDGAADAFGDPFQVSGRTATFTGSTIPSARDVNQTES